MSSCAVRSCGSRQGIDKKNLSGITFHRFPKNPVRREAWVNFVRRGNWQPKKSSVLCSKHFSEECFDRTSQCVVRLKSDAVPTLKTVQPQLIELKPLANIEEANNTFNCNTSKQDQGNNLVVKVENSKCYLNESIKDELACHEILNEGSGYLVNTGSSLGSDNVNFNEQENNSYSVNEKSEENELLPSYRAEEEETTHMKLQAYMEDETLQALSSLKNENNLSCSFHIEPIDSQHIESKPSSILSKDIFKQDQVNNLDEAVNDQLTSVKILKEDDDDDVDERHSESISYSFNENYENDLLHNYHAGVQQIDPNELPIKVEEETVEPLIPCEGKGCVPSFTAFENLKEHSNKHLPTLCHHATSELEPNKATDLCRLCSRRCLARHKKTHIEQKSFVCKFCKKRFSRARNLTIHERGHTGERPYSCNTCGKSFRDRSTLTGHYRIHSGEKPFVCTQCGSSWVNSSQLKKHMRVHTGERPHQCNLCTKSFTNSADLKRHTIEIHTDERNHVCDICHKRFSLKSRLKEHMIIHTGKRNHVCDICHKAFTRKNALKTHMTIHTGARNYICHICNKGFSQKGTLKTHMTLHTGENPFRCNVCNKAFAHKGNYSAHMKSHKGKEELQADEEITLL